MTQKSPSRAGRDFSRLIDDLKNKRPINYRPTLSELQAAMAIPTIQRHAMDLNDVEIHRHLNKIDLTAFNEIKQIPEGPEKERLIQIYIDNYNKGVDAAMFAISPQMNDLKVKLNRATVDEYLYPNESERIAALTNAFLGWARGCLDGMTLGKPEHSAFQTLEEQEKGMFENLGKDYFYGAVKGAQVFLVQHDWHKLIKDSEADEGDVKLPADKCAFEMEINAHRVIAVYDEGNGWKPTILVRFAKSRYPALERDFWTAASKSDNIEVLPVFINSLVRATCIMIEARVAETEMVRAPLKLNEQRLKNSRPPLRDYHIVRLDRRHRVAPSDEPADSTERRRPRLHFRRSHWRHYENHKTWIPWTLAGNPELGWVDKEYRL